MRFIEANAINDHPMIYWGIGTVWALMLFATFFSIRSQASSLWVRFIWLLLVVALPGIGLLLYLLWCLTRFDYSFLKFVVGPPRTVSSKGKGAGA
ncbi:PLDc N-terminal domain-containing protein [Phragmitibacter flavus]|nr:PLDc N-terminal domain-containing protein [Phragmitibacter flavus]